MKNKRQPTYFRVSYISLLHVDERRSRLSKLTAYMRPIVYGDLTNLTLKEQDMKTLQNQASRLVNRKDIFCVQFEA